MAISLETLYQPVNDFFLKKFQTNNDSKVFFRFDKFGSKVSDEDFTDPPNNPEEEFSDFVNRVPIEDSDGVNISFLDKKIDESYRYQILSPALPFIPENSDDSTKEYIEKTFNELHAHAINEFDQKGWQARRGVASQFWVSYASPGNWYDRNNNEIWETFSYKANEPADKKTDGSSTLMLLKLRLNDEQLQNALPVLGTSQSVKPKELIGGISRTDSGLQKLASTNEHITVDRRNHSNDVSPKRRAGFIWVNNHWEREKSTTPVTQPQVSPYQNFHRAFAGLNFNNKIVIAKYIKEKATTQSIKSNSITISFDYCVVNISRPWLVQAFLDNKLWYIPNYEKDNLNVSENLSVLPIGFIVLKNLKIISNWSDIDKENIEQATDFGPFQIDSQVNENGSVGHEGIQVIGWILQKISTSQKGLEKQQ